MKINWDIDDGVYEDEDKDKVYKNNLLNDLEDDEEIDDIKEQKMLQTLDPDLLKYFNEARVTKKKLINKKTKKEKMIFEVGDKVKFNNTIGHILYGPYEKNNKNYYEIETSNGIISVEDKGNNICKT